MVLPGGGPGDPDRFYLPDWYIEEAAKRAGVPVYKMLTGTYAANVMSVQDAHEADDLAYRLGGRAVKPEREIILMGADGKTPILMPGFGVTEAAELEETAQAVYERQRAKLDAGKPIVDFDELRAKEGLPPTHLAGEFMKEAIWERAKRHKRNPITDPARQVGGLHNYVQGVTHAT